MRHSSHLLRYLMSTPALSIFSVGVAALSLLVAAEVYILIAPFILPALFPNDPTFNAPTPELLVLPFTIPLPEVMGGGGLELGYWVGGLLVLTFIRKLVYREYPRIFQVLVCMPMLLQKFHKRDGEKGGGGEVAEGTDENGGEVGVGVGEVPSPRHKYGDRNSGLLEIYINIRIRNVNFKQSKSDIYSFSYGLDGFVWIRLHF
jgi:hypothetical protein